MMASRQQSRQAKRAVSPAPMRRPGAVDVGSFSAPSAVSGGSGHPLCDVRENDRLYQYERNVKDGFDNIIPVLRKISALQHETDFERQAQILARQELGFELPESILADAWV
jgi:hypothetical protein